MPPAANMRTKDLIMTTCGYSFNFQIVLRKHSNKELLWGMIREISPDNGPWFEVIPLLKMYDEAFNDSVASITRKGMPTNCIACISHMLCDERFLVCIIPLTEVANPAARPEELDHIKATGKTKVDAVYDEAHKLYQTWVKDYEIPFVDGLFSDDQGAIQPELATFKDGTAIHALVRSTVQKVETILKIHQQSGYHSSGVERLIEIKSSFLSPKGKNVDIGNFYAFLLLETKDLKFASRMDPGVGASAGLGTVGGGVAATMHRKRDASEAALSELYVLARHLSENSDQLRNTAEKAMVHLFSPSPTFTDISCNASDGVSSSSYAVAKASKVVVERKLLCLKEQMDYHIYVLMSDHYDADEKKKAKKELAGIMQQLKELTK